MTKNVELGNICKEVAKPFEGNNAEFILGGGGLAK
jgi:hypothetical protein